VTTPRQGGAGRGLPVGADTSWRLGGVPGVHNKKAEEDPGKVDFGYNSAAKRVLNFTPEWTTPTESVT
jgi:hypothetical protein